MNIKTTTPVKVMYLETQTTLKDIRQHVFTTPMDIMNEAEKLGLKTNRLQHWVYFGASGDPDNVFTLQICLEVEGEAESDKYKFQELPALKCVTTEHLGSWENFGETYEPFFKDIYAASLQPTNEVREVYHNVDMETPANNVTEIQVGIQ